MSASATVIQGDCIETMRALEAGTVQTCITSPPYFGLRDYQRDGQIGQEANAEAFAEKMVEVFAEVKRLLRDDGTLWLNLGDTYDKDKRLLGVPWLTAFALQRDGWILRSDIIWHKADPIPSGAKDRCSSTHEYMFMFAKSPKYFFDMEPIKTPNAEGGRSNKRTVWKVATAHYDGDHFAVFPEDLIKPCVLSSTPEGGCCAECGAPYIREVESTRVPTRGAGTVQTKTEGKDEAEIGNRDKQRHTTRTRTLGFARQCECRTNATNTRSMVLDPFNGSGTTGLVAIKNGCDYIGCELNEDYAQQAQKRLDAEQSQGKLFA